MTLQTNKKGIYLAVSEQRSCALACATVFKGILCTAAGGYLVERLPDCPESNMAHVAENLSKLLELDGGNTIPTNLLLEGKTPIGIAELVLYGLGMQPLNSFEPKALCKCSDDKLIRSVRLLPREDVDHILSEEGQVEARCQFCGRVYRMGPEEVEMRLAMAKGDPSKDEDFGN
jgi:molecular chaperone Hsp33